VFPKFSLLFKLQLTFSLLHKLVNSFLSIYPHIYELIHLIDRLVLYFPLSLTATSIIRTVNIVTREEWLLHYSHLISSLNELVLDRFIAPLGFSIITTQANASLDGFYYVSISVITFYHSVITYKERLKTPRHDNVHIFFLVFPMCQFSLQVVQRNTWKFAIEEVVKHLFCVVTGRYIYKAPVSAATKAYQMRIVFPNSFRCG